MCAPGGFPDFWNLDRADDPGHRLPFPPSQRPHVAAHRRGRWLSETNFTDTAARATLPRPIVTDGRFGYLPLENVIVKNPKASTPATSPVRSSLPLVNAEELAEFFGCSPRSIRRLVAEGKIPAPLRFSGSPRWNLRAIEQWIWAGAKASPRKGSR